MIQRLNLTEKKIDSAIKQIIMVLGKSKKVKNTIL